MSTKEKDLLELHSYIEGIDKEVTMILQSLQWDRKHLIEGRTLVDCRNDSAHKVPPDKKDIHETECLLRSQGYTGQDILLPDAVDPAASTVVKLSKTDIDQMIQFAALTDPLFKKGSGCDVTPLTAERLQAAYTADERRVIHDAVVGAMPDSWHGEDVIMPSEGGPGPGGVVRTRKSRLQVLAELRDMRRRRVRYRGAGSSGNYSHVIRDLINTQMEVYTGVLGDDNNTTTDNNKQQHTHREKQHDNKDTNKDMNLPRDKYRNRRDDYRADKRNEKRTDQSYPSDRTRHVEQHTRKDRYDRHDKRDSTNERHIKVENADSYVEIKKEVDENMDYEDRRNKDKEHRDNTRNYKNYQHVSGRASSNKRGEELKYQSDSRSRYEESHSHDKYNDNYDRRKYHHHNDRSDTATGIVRSIKIERHEDNSSSRSDHSEYTERFASKGGNKNAHNNEKDNERASASNKRYHERSGRDYNESGNENANRTNKYDENVSSSRKRQRDDGNRDDYFDSSRKKVSSHHGRSEHDHMRAHKSENYKDSCDSSRKRRHGDGDRKDCNYVITRRADHHSGGSNSKNSYRSKDRSEE